MTKNINLIDILPSNNLHLNDILSNGGISLDFSKYRILHFALNFRGKYVSDFVKSVP